jgi:hypothetical protein
MWINFLRTWLYYTYGPNDSFHTYMYCLANWRGMLLVGVVGKGRGEGLAIYPSLSDSYALVEDARCGGNWYMVSRHVFVTSALTILCIGYTTLSGFKSRDTSLPLSNEWSIGCLAWEPIGVWFDILRLTLSSIDRWSWMRDDMLHVVLLDIYNKCQPYTVSLYVCTHNPICVGCRTLSCVYCTNFHACNLSVRLKTLVPAHLHIYTPHSNANPTQSVCMSAHTTLYLLDFGHIPASTVLIFMHVTCLFDSKTQSMHTYTYTRQLACPALHS